MVVFRWLSTGSVSRHCYRQPLTSLHSSRSSFQSHPFSTSALTSKPATSNKQWKPPTPSANSSQNHSRREWALVGVAGSAAAVGSWYYWSNIRPHRQSAETSGDSRPFSSAADVKTPFMVPSDSRQPGEPANKVVTPLSSAEVDQRLKENERSTRVDRPSGACLVARYDVNSVASNNPIEDRRAEVIVERDQGIVETNATNPSKVVPNDNGDLCFFTIMDGHAGYRTSTVLSQKLIASVALELDKVFRETDEYNQIAKAKASTPSKIWSSLFGASGSSRGLDGDPEIIKRAIAKAFLNLDKELLNTPVELLKEYELGLASSSSSAAIASNDNLTAIQKSGHESLLRALNGSCALLTYIDSARNDVYVACTGDSRAVAGYWDEAKGRWEVDVLSVDQTGRNLDEVKRVKSEHPASEAEHVIKRGRVLGSLEPTRAFGDARFKWDRELQFRLSDVFIPGGRNATRPPPARLETPPYVTARPEVQWRRVGQTSSRELRFMVMATDGLWDMMSNEEVVALVAGHLAGIKGNILASDLHRQCFEPVTSDQQQRLTSSPQLIEQALDKSKQHPLSKGSDHLKAFSFQDDNLSTHLIRNALGGANRKRVAGLLAIPSPESRSYRDDITVNVILFSPPKSNNEKPVQSKL